MPRKAPQCQADDPAHDWTHEELLRVMAADHLSAWDPYIRYDIRYGMYETLNDEALPPRFNAIVSGSDSNLNANDRLDGGTGDNHLFVEMKSSFRGFDGVAKCGHGSAGKQNFPKLP